LTTHGAHATAPTNQQPTGPQPATPPDPTHHPAQAGHRQTLSNVTSEPARSPAADTSGAATQDARVHYAVHKQQTATSPTRHQTPPPSPKPHGPGSDGSRYGEDRHRPQGTKPNRARSLRTQQCAQTTKPRHNHLPTPTHRGRY